MSRNAAPTGIQDERRSVALDRRDRLDLRLESVGFTIGGLLFAAGATMAMLGWGPANATYALGAVFFTSAAAVQWRASVHHFPGWRHERRRAEADLTSPDWLAAVVQFAGTLYFNVMTIRALTVQPWEVTSYDSEVWHPNVMGCLLFLVASLIALHPLSRERRHRLVRGRSKLIVYANLVGSVCFAVSAIASYAIPPGVIHHPDANNIGTFVGGLAFAYAAVLMWPPREATT